MLLDVNTTVGQFVAERPSRSRVFERLGIDYCCGGKKPLAQACAERGLSADKVLAMLEGADAVDQGQAVVDADRMSLTGLADHIEQTHHAYLRRELPRTGTLLTKVATVHGAKDSRLKKVLAVFDGFVDELNTHMAKEEQILFPMIRQLEQSSSVPCFHCGSVANPIAVMEHEHDAAGDALAQMRSLTDGYTPPAWACNTYRAVLDGLADLEHNMHQHVHKENNVLFPKAIARERELANV